MPTLPMVSTPGYTYQSITFATMTRAITLREQHMSCCKCSRPYLARGCRCRAWAHTRQPPRGPRTCRSLNISFNPPSAHGPITVLGAVWEVRHPDFTPCPKINTAALGQARNINCAQPRSLLYPCRARCATQDFGPVSKKLPVRRRNEVGRATPLSHQ
jgi:hypothetical protein